ncbi:FN1 [Mytilus coruscus]|uniref:FN1 n=1 Tax=Mytilus coruscus TaxID=42192 RepID=A0A6J8AEK0_MYTCO|nr:FN1 [Mytilus coruscus]
MLCIPCEAAVEHLSCTASNSSSCNLYGNAVCRCMDNYYDHVGITCYQKSALEETCINGQPANQCSLQETDCIPATSGSSDYKCLCQAGYYSDSPSCKPLVDLQVTNLDVPNDERGETYFLVTWTNPSTVGSINKYELILTFNGKSDVFSNIPTSETQHNVTSRIPGRKYSISLVSVETHSRPSQQTTSAAITDGYIPSVPGDIIQNAFNAPVISISWTITGDIEYLSGKVNDSSVNPVSFNKTAVSRMSPSVSFYNLRYGERYTFTVRSQSNGFESDLKIQTIRTTPTTPQTPRDFACTDLNILDRSLTLTWREPLLPNGDIKHYIVYDLNRSLQLQTNGSVLEQFIEGLQPGKQTTCNEENIILSEVFLRLWQVNLKLKI